MGIKYQWVTRMNQTIQEKYQEIGENIERNYRRGLFSMSERDAAMDRLADEFIAECERR